MDIENHFKKNLRIAKETGLINRIDINDKHNLIYLRSLSSYVNKRSISNRENLLVNPFSDYSKLFRFLVMEQFTPPTNDKEMEEFKDFCYKYGIVWNAWQLFDEYPMGSNFSITSDLKLVLKSRDDNRTSYVDFMMKFKYMVESI